MSENNKKGSNKILYGILFLMIGLIIGASVSSQYTNTGLWSLNDTTVVLNNSAYNVNIGENKSTGYKLNINGSVCIQDGLCMNSTAIGFKNGVTMPPFVYLTGNDLLFIQATYNHTIWLYNSFFKIGTGFPNYVDKLTINSSGDIDTVGHIKTSSYLEGYGVVPIASPIAWCGDMYGLSIPNNFVVCNGSLITDIDSILYGYNSPNMTDKFIKGNAQSNITGGNNSYLLLEDNLPQHDHDLPNNIMIDISYATGFPSSGSGSIAYVKNAITEQKSITGGRIVGSDVPFDNQPAYFTVIYIMRIK